MKLCRAWLRSHLAFKDVRSIAGKFLNMRKYFMVKPLLLAFGLSNTILGQEMTHLKLQDALGFAFNQNHESILASLEQESSAAKFHQTNAVFLPLVNLSYTAFTTNNPLNAFGFKLQQQSITQTDFDPRLLNNPSATQNFMAKAEVNQPLINMDMHAKPHTSKLIYTHIKLSEQKSTSPLKYIKHTNNCNSLTMQWKC